MRPALPASRRKQGVYAGHFNGQVALLENGVPVQVGHGDFRRGDQEHLLVFRPVHVFLELGKLAVPSMHSRLTMKGTPTSW